MIARMWRGTTVPDDADRYLAYLERTGVADLGSTPGNRGVLVLRRVAGDRAEFTLISLWEDEEAVQRFTGSDPARAVFYPEDDAFLVERETRVTHWEATGGLVESTASAAGRPADVPRESGPGQAV